MWDGGGGDWKAPYRKENSAGTGKEGKGMPQTAATAGIKRGCAAINIKTAPPAGA